ncbi:MAG: orotidine-5'-phosphate decarboxylase [Bowdeniella nasicola]|nr:orotidine-5'-phosphate decarboxylase [Bowdeniella nasicola]
MNARVNAGARLAKRMERYGPLCVGIDPHPHLLENWGLPVSAQGVRDFAQIVVDELADGVAALKPQVAFFESYGAAGYAALEDCLGRARERGHFTILDAKRGDIGSTMAGYANAVLRPGAPFEADALTLSPYLGFGSLAPALDLAEEHDRALFVLVLTSNPEGASVQHARTPTGTVAGDILAAAAATNARICAASSTNVGPIGTVVGATIGDAARRLGIDLTEFNGIHLAPGVGAQGAGARECADVFGSSRVLAAASRTILAAGPGGLARARDTVLTELRGH